MKTKNLNGGICSGRGNIFCARFVSQLSKLSYECTRGGPTTPIAPSTCFVYL